MTTPRRPRRNNVMVVGSIALDTVQTHHGKAEDVLGGSATYFALSASLFGGVRLVGVVGRDFPERYMRLLEEHGVDLEGLHIARGKTFRWSGVYGENLNERTTLSVALNVMEGFAPRLPVRYRDTRYVFLANIDPQTQDAVLRQVKKPHMVVCDTMNLWIETRREELLALLPRIDILILNDEEARMLTGISHIVAAGRKLLDMGLRGVIVKKGEHGALLCTPGDLCALPAYPTEHVVDPTGAGDSFGGGFIGHLAATGDCSPAGLRRAMVYGTVVASFTVEDFSTRRLEGISLPDVEQRVEKIRSMVRF